MKSIFINTFNYLIGPKSKKIQNFILIKIKTFSLYHFEAYEYKLFWYE